MKKKEIFAIIIIVGLTIFLAFLPTIINSNNKKDDDVILKEEKQNILNIKITGELKIEEINLKIPYGYTYGYIIQKIDPYLNEYSIVSDDLKKRYYSDETIIIESKDINNEVVIDTLNKININKASSEELISLYGIGEKRAQAIIDYRKNKKIETFSELKELLGVSDEVINNIKDKAILQ